jgi:hypothetical protein
MGKSRSKHCDCPARVNIGRTETGAFCITSIDLIHSHAALFDDQLPEYLPPLTDQKNFVRELAPLQTLGCRDIHTLLKAHFPNHPLTPRQVTNLIDTSKWEAHNHVDNLGGDLVATVELLIQRKQEDERWVVFVESDPDTC